MIINHVNRFIFVHICKTGGTTIKNIFRHRFGKDFNQIKKLELDTYYGHVPLSEIENHVDLKSYNISCIVRNPWDLVVSKFFYHNSSMLKRKYNHADPKKFYNNLNIENPVERVGISAPSIQWNERKDISKNTIRREFFKWASESGEHINAHTRASLDGFKPRCSYNKVSKDRFSNLTLQYEHSIKNQVDFISSASKKGSKILANKIYRFENFQTAIDKIVKSADHRSRNMKYQLKTRKNMSTKPWWYTSYRDMYNDQCIDLVYRFYKRDIEAFGYEY